MKRTICGKLYDTETATLIERRTFGTYGEAAGYEERLYRTPEGFYFLYALGGTSSPYPEEHLTRLSAKTAEAWRASEGE
ncbi:MAG: hypothetical protein IJV96_01325 [Clostridia bacterium]|nr:hypothetical protein [Clostridia bacterium]